MDKIINSCCKGIIELYFQYKWWLLNCSSFSRINSDYWTWSHHFWDPTGTQTFTFKVRDIISTSTTNYWWWERQEVQAMQLHPEQQVPGSRSGSRVINTISSKVGRIVSARNLCVCCLGHNPSRLKSWVELLWNKTNAFFIRSEPHYCGVKIKGHRIYQ